jgi:hypothetical protein
MHKFAQEQSVSDPIYIDSLVPQPLPDLRRVSLLLRVSGLPAYGPSGSSNLIQFYDMPQPPQGTQEENTSQPPDPYVDLFPEMESSPPVNPSSDQERSPSPYPDLKLSILDRHGNEVATTFVIEHKEPELDFTLHLRGVEAGATYTARAEMTQNDKIIQTVQVPFELK